MPRYLLFVFSLLTVSSNCFSNEVEIFTKNLEQTLNEVKSFGSKRHSFTIHDLEAVNKFENLHSQGLPNDEVSAKRVFKERLASYGEKNFTNDIMAAYQPMMRSFELGVEAYPAVVIDMKYVVYGTSNITLALKEYKKWISKSY